MRARILAVVAAVTLGAGAAIVVPPGAGASSSKLPVQYSSAAAISAALQEGEGASPPGANDWSCKPSAAHPRPVVLVHATFITMGMNWNTLSPLLKNNGYCVFALNYGGKPILGYLGAYGSIDQSAGELATFVDRVLASTGASTVDLVGHSQGGMMPRYYIKFLGGASKVTNQVGLSPSNHGTTMFGLTKMMDLVPGISKAMMSVCAACIQQVAGSDFLTTLNAGGGTVPGVMYTVIQTKYDEVVTPYQSAFMPAGPNVRNITVQDQCWLDFSEHLGIAFDHIALQDVLNALDPAHAKTPSCSYIPPILGG